MRSLIAIATVCCCASVAFATSPVAPASKTSKPICKANEVIDPCPSPCPPEPNCDQYLTNVQYLCAEVPPGTPCVPACRCANNLVRNKKGICIDPRNCCDDENAEVVDCPGPCPATCENPIPGNCTVDFCQFRGCQCKSGFVLHKEKCIRVENCPYPPKCPGPNEVYVSCKDPCPETCESLFQAGPKPQCLPPYPCPAGCNCIQGYVRDKNDKCVKKEDCPPPLICKENEVLNLCAKPCVPGEMQYCYEYLRDKANDCEPPPKLPCELRCDCKPGYLRNDKGICVKKENCCEDPNEIVVDCPDPCPLSCANLDTHDKFPCGKMCVKRGCSCRDGYVRDNNNNKCIPRDQCPAPLKCGRNEVFNPCAGYCTFDDDCGSVIFGFIRDCAAPPEDYQCPQRCDCKKGFVRMDTGCELVDKCCKGPNEEITDCPAPCDETCEGKPAADCQLTPCSQKGCRCKKGFVRDANGSCVLKSKCPSCSNPNEVFKTCGTACEPTCDDRNPGCTKQCVQGCFCKDGYIRDKNKKCIPIKDCPAQCTGENEEYTECGGCDPTCEAPNLVCKIACQKGCFCKKGFVRENGKCIDPKTCPKKCNENEIFKTCGTCDPTCKNLNPTCPQVCRTGCFCEDGFARDDNGKCIDAKLCPPKEQSCKGANEIWRICFGGCDPTCEAPNRQCRGCINGCFCKDGYVRDKNRICIKLADCPKPIKCTGPFEEYSDCTNPCPPGAVCIAACIPGCVCIEGYVRKNNVCVKKIEPIKCTKPNEVYSECVNDCPPGKVCATVCRPGCVCKPGFVRKNGICVHNYDKKSPTPSPTVGTTKCSVATKPTPKPSPTPSPCGKFENRVDCMPTKEATCEDRKTIPGNIKLCRPGCTCMPGYFRNYGQCIPAKDCKPCA